MAIMEPSPKVDITMDMAIDDGSPDGGGSRRPGNLWTVEAREDMFRRREAGETWETICQVSIQQYSSAEHAAHDLNISPNHEL